MRKLAIFVEGYTEIAFVQRLLFEIAGANNVLIQHIRILGGTSVPRRSEIVHAARESTGERYYVLLVDCGGDVQVKTRILEEHQRLTEKGYWKIIGLRDVRPQFTREEIPRLELGLKTYVKTALAPVEFILAVMEFEAWFLAEWHHFPIIDGSITKEAIQQTLGLDVEKDDMALRDSPQTDLNACYAIGGQSYEKQSIDRTINALDYDHIYFGLISRIPQLARLIAQIEEFLAPELT